MCANDIWVITFCNGSVDADPKTAFRPVPTTAVFRQGSSVQARIAGTPLLAFSGPSELSGHKGSSAGSARKGWKQTAQCSASEAGMVRYGLRSGTHVLCAVDWRGEGSGCAGHNDSASWSILVGSQSTEGVDDPTGNGHQIRNILSEAEPAARQDNGFRGIPDQVLFPGERFAATTF